MDISLEVWLMPKSTATYSSTGKTCWVSIDANYDCVYSDTKETGLPFDSWTDDNVHSHCFLPLFPFQYGNLTLPEDTAVGSIILTIQATDADEPHTGSSKILYRIIQGDSDGRLEVETDLQTNAGYVKVKKVKKFFID